MRERVIGLSAATVAAVVAGSILVTQKPLAVAQEPASDDWTVAAGTTAAATTALPAFDSRDIGGYWSRGNPEGGPGRCVTSQGPCGDRFFSIKNWPRITPEGKARFESYRPSYGRLKDTPDAEAHPEEHIGYRRSVQPALGNDPQGTCNPLGASRLTLFNQQSELIILVDRIIQHVDQTNAWRTWWMDGRELPAPEEVDLPAWHGYSVARWEGNTLIVETVGQDDRTWVDVAGFPLSEQAHLEERYTRTAYDTLELNMVLTDPLFYEEPWVSDTKRFQKIEKDYFANLRWQGLYEEECAPADEIFEFRRRVVIPAAEGADVPY